MKMTVVIFAFLLVIAVVWPTSTSAINPLQSELKDLIDKRKTLNLLRAIMDELGSNLVTINKRSCEFNLPGVQCDNLEYIANVIGGNTDWWTDREEAEVAKGNKRAPCLNFDGTACITAQTAEEMKNRKEWKVGPGRKKRQVTSHRF